MDLTLPEHTASVVAELTRWAASRPVPDATAEDDAEGWSQLVEFGLFDMESDGGTLLDIACGVMAAARTPLPGPVVEADLAVAAAGDASRKALADGDVVTSLPPGPAGRAMVGWGARAALVVDQSGGTVLAEGPLPAVSNAYDLPHGWYERTTANTGADRLQARRWTLSAAASAGLAAGALDAAVRHAKDRELFGRTLSSFQAVQLRLAESVVLLEGVECLVRDAAWRLAEGKPQADVAAALAWLYAAPSVRTVCGHAHQVFGALGFATETGLYRYTAQAQWLRLATPTKPAARFVTSHRAQGGGTPPSLVMAGFREP
jgi:hypothetical protein